MKIKIDGLTIPLHSINSARILKYPTRLELFVSGDRKIIIRCDYAEASRLMDELINASKQRRGVI